MPNMKFVFSIIPGFEDICIKEIKEKTNADAQILRIFDLRVPEKLLGEIKQPLKKKKNREKKIFDWDLRSVTEIYRYLAQFSFKDLKELVEKFKKIKLGEIKKYKTFRVTTKIKSNENIKRNEVERQIGEYIYEKYNIKGDMKNAEVEVHIEIYGNLALALLKEKHLNIKNKTPYFTHVAGTKLETAYCLVRLATIDRKQNRKKIKIIDPFMGCGSIPIEAALYLGKNAEIIGSDISEKFIELAKENISKIGLYEYNINFIKADATKIDKMFSDNHFDYIITDPPYGIKIKWYNIKKLYQEFLEAASKILKKYGKIVLMTPRAESFRHIVYRNKKYIIEEERVIGKGILKPHVFVLRKIS